MPVLLILAHGALSFAPPVTFSIPPPVAPAVNVAGDEHRGSLTSKFGSIDALAHTLRTHRFASFVDAGEPEVPAGNPAGSEGSQQALKALNSKMKTISEDMDALEDAHHQNIMTIANLEEAAKIAGNAEQTNRAQINNLVKVYSGLTHRAAQEEHVQGTASALQQDVKSEAGELVNAANAEDRELESTDQNRDTQKVQLDALTGTLFNKIQTGQAHHNTLTAWAMRVAFNTNVATSDMEQLRGDLLTLDDTISTVSDNLLELFRQVQSVKKPET